MDNQNKTTVVADANDAQQNKVMAVLAYLFLLVLVPLLAAKESPFARYHTNQGLWLVIADVIAAVVVVIPILGWLVACVWFVARLVFTVMGIMNAVNGKMEPLPGFASLPAIIK